jgi:hypothetical protein
MIDLYLWAAICSYLALREIVYWMDHRAIRREFLNRVSATRVLVFSLERRLNRMGCAQAELVRRFESTEGNQQ